MGKKEKTQLRVVLDTNILVSALIFGGNTARVAELWKAGRILPVISKETFSELKAVLKYPKFKLTDSEIQMLVEDEILPFFEVAEISDYVSGICSDPDDDKFISCALLASADYVVTGDRHLIDVGTHKTVKIIPASELLNMFKLGEYDEQ